LLTIAGFSVCACLPLVAIYAQDPEGPKQAEAAKKKAARPVRPGVSTPGVKRDISTITPAAAFEVEGVPDWQVVTEDAVWVSNGPKNVVHRLDTKTNKVAATIPVGQKPCSGLAAGFGSVWVPNCGDKSVSRVDIKTNKVVATLPVGPADTEGGVTASADAVWIVSDPKGKLSRIDPKKNQVVAEIDVPPGSASCLHADGIIWITSPARNVVTRVNAKTNKLIDSIPVGPAPRFLTFGAGSIWTLNQGDGTVSRVDTKTGKVSATVEVGVPGGGGEIAFGLGHVWVTVFQIPLSKIDPASNKVVKQWAGAGGDSVRAAHGSVWLSNLREHNIWRIDPSQL
jgi:virginiamycin B lyase